MATVFPACAGMFLEFEAERGEKFSFPRVRGDVPLFMQLVEACMPFSPRARGCSSISAARIAILRVFPACAGMFLRSSRKSQRLARFPRVRGDVPAV